MENKGYILMLESDEHDRELSRNYFDTHSISFKFLNLSNEVLPFLKEKERANTLPALIILSMNSFPDNGLEVLTKVKAIDTLKHIPIIILGENTQHDLIKDCYAKGASTFINKPFTTQLTDISIRSFIHYWFEVAQLPSQQFVHSTVKV